MNEKRTILQVDARLKGKNDLYLADSTGHPHRHLVLMSIEHQIETRGSDREIPNLNPLEERWKHRTIETHEATSSIDLHSQTGLQ